MSVLVFGNLQVVSRYQFLSHLANLDHQAKVR
jgi:hypothetical protein